MSLTKITYAMIQGIAVNVLDYGADPTGVANSATAINNALTYANSLGNSVLVFPPGTNFKCNTGLTFYPNNVTIQGNGAIIDFSGMTSGYAISFSQSSNDANARNSLNKAHPISGLYFTGPSGTVPVTAVKGIDDQSHPSLSGYWLSGITFRDCQFMNFYRDVEFGDGAFLWQFFNCSFAITGGTGYDCSQLMQSGSNNGENIEYIACFFGNAGKGIRCLNGNASMFFRGCSGDYVTLLLDVQGGYVEWDGYIESSNDLNYWAKVSGVNSVLRITGKMAVAGNKSAYEIFYSDSTAIQGGLILDLSISIGGGIAYNPPSYNLIAGTGRAVINLRSTDNATQHYPIGGGTNQLAYGDFESANYTVEWTLASGAIRSSAQKRNGTYSLSFPSSGGVTASGYHNTPCKPGQFFTCGLWYLVPTITGTGGTFYMALDYLDAGGNSLSSGFVLAQTTNVTAWTHLNACLTVPAPIGTVNARISISLFGVSTGTPIGYIDDVTLAVV